MSSVHRAEAFTEAEPTVRVLGVLAASTLSEVRRKLNFERALASRDLLSPGLLAEAVPPQCAGRDLVFGHDNAWGLGFGVDGDYFGMGGSGGSYGGACPAGGYCVGFVTGSIGSFDRADALENTLRECLGLPPLPQ